MKKPNEIAEEIAIKTYREWFDHQGLCSNLPIFMAKEIPLTELIALAFAAKESLRNAAVFGDEDIKLVDALEALRKTGKIEGL